MESVGLTDNKYGGKNNAKVVTIVLIKMGKPLLC